MFWLAKVSVFIALSHRAIRVCIISFVQKQLERRSSCCGGDAASRQINIFPRWMTTWSGLWAPGAFCCTSKWRDVFMNLICRCSKMRKKKQKHRDRDTRPEIAAALRWPPKTKTWWFSKTQKAESLKLFVFFCFFFLPLNIHASNACRYTANKKKKSFRFGNTAAWITRRGCEHMQICRQTGREYSHS